MTTRLDKLDSNQSNCGRYRFQNTCPAANIPIEKVSHATNKKTNPAIIRYQNFYNPMNKDTVLHLKNKLVLIRGENVTDAPPSRFYVHIDGKMFPDVFKTYHAARLFAGKIVAVLP